MRSMGRKAFGYLMIISYSNPSVPKARSPRKTTPDAVMTLSSNLQESHVSGKG